MKIKYLFHSGFVVETEHRFLVFDYFKDNCIKQKDDDCGKLTSADFSSDKPVVFFVSHAHYDHYDKEIFKLAPNAKYLISNDLRIKNSENIITCEPYEKYFIDEMEVSTFGSTDAGVSFLVKIDGFSIFHAGDLNWWHWNGETDEERENAKCLFYKEMKILDGVNIDIAMFPIDPRLESAFYYGGKYFIEKINPSIFIPMHFQDSYSITDKFKEIIDDLKLETRVITISKRGQILDI